MIERRQQYYLQAIGIDVWCERAAPEAGLEVAQPAAGLAPLQAEVAACTACPLHCSRTQTVFGVGNPHADLLFIGEAPGANEDLEGMPFVGRAGHLLDNMMKSIGLERNQVYIANILKCRPPNNRDPNPEEVATCTPFLTRQIVFIQPKLIVALGRIAAQFLLGSTQSLTRLRVGVHQYGETKIPLVATFHPAYLLRSPREKAVAYQDWLRIRNLSR